MLDLTLIQYGGLNQMILRLCFFSSFDVDISEILSEIDSGSCLRTVEGWFDCWMLSLI